ncbi:uncharacterized protein PGTG_17353 [Puccinia graminis f. sp. tritici CRL 75-36-700-3]|uniref:Uncharacterized protein n=1 Tax=Puccinia graminis f. sp. tritici (strain CRL 75-36-700-3 / race SCCL) TaxID=418459 RepID=E3L4C2_PUCGT|nr:uncharacterized protein PGTG_17353 [Puccinia graminis f. sp. tritici CRL 75-36-700-3]EFP91397.1 hypothetical protein PGTG_17353 [Puccinia graminis f. sp. tritici CRL 75-36-700-3]
MTTRRVGLETVHPRGTSCRAGSWNRRNSADPWNRRDQLLKITRNRSVRVNIISKGEAQHTTDNCMSLPRGATSGGFIGGFVRSHCAYCRSHARGFVKSSRFPLDRQVHLATRVRLPLASFLRPPPFLQLQPYPNSRRLLGATSEGVKELELWVPLAEVL